MTADFGSLVPKTKLVPEYVRNKPDNGIVGYTSRLWFCGVFLQIIFNMNFSNLYFFVHFSCQIPFIHHLIQCIVRSPKVKRVMWAL